MQIQGIKNKIREILESYLIYIGYKMAFIKDDELTEQIEHRQEQCNGCSLNRRGWCSKRRKTKTIINGIQTTITGCGCFLAAKFFSEYKNEICPLNKWKK